MRLFIISAILFAACLPLFAEDDPNCPMTEDKVKEIVFKVLDDKPKLLKTAVQEFIPEICKKECQKACETEPPNTPPAAPKTKAQTITPKQLGEYQEQIIDRAETYYDNKFDALLMVLSMFLVMVSILFSIGGYFVGIKFPRVAEEHRDKQFDKITKQIEKQEQDHQEKFDKNYSETKKAFKESGETIGKQKAEVDILRGEITSLFGSTKLKLLDLKDKIKIQKTELEGQITEKITNADKKISEAVIKVNCDFKQNLKAIDDKTKAKLKKIEQKLEELKDVGTQITTDAKKERDINPLWIEAYNLTKLARSELDDDEKRRLLVKAVAIYQKATQIKDDFYQGYNNWGSALGRLAKLGQDDAEKRLLLVKAVAKFKKVTQIKVDFPDPYNNSGHALSELADLEKDPRKKSDLFKEAVVLFQKAETL